MLNSNFDDLIKIKHEQETMIIENQKENKKRWSCDHKVESWINGICGLDHPTEEHINIVNRCISNNKQIKPKWEAKGYGQGFDN